MKVGKEKVEASLKDAQMELDKNRETLKNQTEQTEKLSKEVREEGRGERGREGGSGRDRGRTHIVLYQHTKEVLFSQLEALRVELVRSAQERASEVEQYKMEVAAASLKHEEAKSSFDSQVRTNTWRSQHT